MQTHKSLKKKICETARPGTEFDDVQRLTRIVPRRVAIAKETEDNSRVGFGGEGATRDVMRDGTAAPRFDATAIEVVQL